MKDRHPFGELLAAARKSRELSQQAFARSSGIPLSTIQMLERGQRAPGYDVFCRICISLDVPADWFIDGTGDNYVRRIDADETKLVQPGENAPAVPYK